MFGLRTDAGLKMVDAAEPVLLEIERAPRVHADGLAKVMVKNGQVTFVLYTDPLAINPDLPCEERHIEGIITLPAQAVMPAIFMTIFEMARSGYSSMLDARILSLFH